jgi:hypothetical protein
MMCGCWDACVIAEISGSFVSHAPTEKLKLLTFVRLRAVCRLHAGTSPGSKLIGTTRPVGRAVEDLSKSLCWEAMFINQEAISAKGMMCEYFHEAIANDRIFDWTIITDSRSTRCTLNL